MKKPGKARKDRETQPEDSGAPIFAPPPPAEAPLPPPPPAEDIAPPSSPPISGDDAQNKKDGKPKRKKDRDAPCPDGMVALEELRHPHRLRPRRRPRRRRRSRVSQGRIGSRSRKIVGRQSLRRRHHRRRKLRRHRLRPRRTWHRRPRPQFPGMTRRTRRTESPSARRTGTRHVLTGWLRSRMAPACPRNKRERN